MGKEVIQCEYCHTLITEKDVVCPKCGANCSEVIKKYREEQNKKQEENEKFVKDIFKKNTNFVRTIGIIMFIIAFVVFFMIFSNIMRSNNRRDNTIKEMNNTNHVDDVKEVKDINVNYNEEAESDDMKVIIDSYEFYEYHSDSFQSYNTLDGYQKIAFHFSITNKGTNPLFTSMLIGLTADNTPVEDADLELKPGFAELVTGREKYDSIENVTIRNNDTMSGYLGFLVPKDKKTLKFRVGNNIYITMENPAYQG